MFSGLSRKGNSCAMTQIQDRPNWGGWLLKLRALLADQGGSAYSRKVFFASRNYFSIAALYKASHPALLIRTNRAESPGGLDLGYRFAARECFNAASNHG
jgi:hypothetical protein